MTAHKGLINAIPQEDKCKPNPQTSGNLFTNPIILHGSFKFKNKGKFLKSSQDLGSVFISKKFTEKKFSFHWERWDIKGKSEAKGGGEEGINN